VVLLIDEVDRSDDEFEAFLLEFLSDFAVTIPELGTVRADRRPVVVLTSNRTRELHDALKRRCLYHWIDYPSPGRERAIVEARIPGISDAIAERVVPGRGPVARAWRPVQAARGRRDRWSGLRALTAIGEDGSLDDTLGAATQGARGPREGPGAEGARGCLTPGGR